MPSHWYDLRINRIVNWCIVPIPNSKIELFPNHTSDWMRVDTNNLQSMDQQRIVSECQQNIQLQRIFEQDVQPKWLENDFVTAMLLGRNNHWRREQMVPLANLLLQVFRISPSNRRSIIVVCLENLDLIPSHPNPKSNPEPKLSASQPMTKEEENWYWKWNNICNAICVYLNNEGERSSGQGIDMETRRKDGWDTIMFAAMVCLPPFIAWFANANTAPPGHPEYDPSAPRMTNKDRFMSFVRNDLPGLVDSLIQGSKEDMADVGGFVSHARADYFATVGVWSPEEQQAEQFDPFAHTKQRQQQQSES